MSGSVPAAVILAAGKSTRMKSNTPKVLHTLCGRPMIEYVMDAARAAGVEKLIVVVGHQARTVQDALSNHSDVVFAEQTEQLGTGHAVMMCESELQDHSGPVLILAGDTPLLESRSLRRLLDEQHRTSAACVIGSADTADNEGLGRIVRDDSGQFHCIREHKDASEDERQITEINTGCYAFDTPLLLESLRELKPDNAQSEYYLTDCPRILMEAGHRVTALCCLTVREAVGVNNRVQLAEVRRHIQQNILNGLMLSGVTIEDPLQTTIDQDVSVGQDTVIRPGTVIDRGARIGSGCRIGPNVHLTAACCIPDGTTVASSSDLDD